MRIRRKLPELNAGSMADIAFLLLIFFLVVTTIVEDKGITVILPEYYEGEPGPVPSRNVLTILIDGEDKLLVESKLLDPTKLKDIVVDFVTNPLKEGNKPKASKNAIISIQNDKNTSYEAYVNIYNHIHKAYYEMRNKMAQDVYELDYTQLSILQKNSILKTYPLKLSEADPFEIN